MWVLLFVFLCQLVFASPELMLLGMAIAGAWLFIRRRKQPNFTALPVTAGRAMWLVPLCFVSVFFFKLLSATWALVPKEAIDSAFNSDYISSIGKRQPRSKLRQPISRQNST
jgi:hypothetical protein